MKSAWVALGWVILGIIFSLMGARADEKPSSPQEVAVPIQRILFPPDEYTDQDDIHVVIEGELPDPCYRLGTHQFKAHPTRQLEISQLAWRDNSGACGNGDLLEPVTFSQQISLGKLPVGDYTWVSSPEGDPTEAFQPLSIHPASDSPRSPSSKAFVSSIGIPDVIWDNSPALLTLEGMLPSPCIQLEKPISVQAKRNIIVIKPIEISNGICNAMIVPFKKVVSLGPLKAGEYLVHIMSKEGRALQKTFTVIAYPARP